MVPDLFRSGPVKCLGKPLNQAYLSLRRAVKRLPGSCEVPSAGLAVVSEQSGRVDGLEQSTALIQAEPAMGSLTIRPAALGPVTAQSLLPRGPRAMSRNPCGLVSALFIIRRRGPPSAASRRLLSSSSPFHYSAHKMPAAKENAWVGYQGPAGFDLRSESCPYRPET